MGHITLFGVFFWCVFLTLPSRDAFKSQSFRNNVYAKALARLCGRVCSSEPSLLTDAINTKMSCAGSTFFYISLY